MRPTEDVDLLLTREGLDRFRSEVVGLDYTLAFEGARKTFRDAATGVKVEVITEGEYPGDGKPKPVAFPNPADVSVDKGGISVIGLRSLVELKLASGLSAPHRLRDLADVQELIARLGLLRALAGELDESVRAEYARGMDLERNGGYGM